MDPLDIILESSIAKTMEEIKDGADSDSFKDLTVINFLIIASRKGYDKQVLKSYIDDLRYEDIIEDETEAEALG